MLFKHIESLVQFLLTPLTVAMTLFLSPKQNDKGIWEGQSFEVKSVVIAIIVLSVIILVYNFYSNSRSQKKFLEKQVALINNIAKLAYELVINEKKSTDNKRNGKRAENGCDDENSVNTPHSIRILVLIHYNNSWYRKIILKCYCIRYKRKIKGEFFKDRFVTIAGYNHQHVITDGIPFDMKSATGIAYIKGITIRQDIQDDNQLGSTNQQLSCVLSTPIVYNGCSVGTLNIDSSDPDSAVCSMENSATLERFAKIIANIVGSDLNGYRSYVAKRYKRYILNVHKIEREQHDKY